MSVSFMGVRFPPGAKPLSVANPERIATGRERITGRGPVAPATGESAGEVSAAAAGGILPT